LGSSNLPGIERVRLDGWALLFALAVAVMAAFLGSVVPAAIAWRNGSASNLNWARRGSTHSGLGQAGAVFVALQFAAGLILLTGSAILLNNFIRLVRMPLGFDPDRLLVMEVSIPYGSPPRDSGFRDEILRRLRLLRGVQGAAIAEPGITEAGLHIDIRPPGRSEKEFPRRYAPMTGISPGFFQTMHIPVLEGRDFTVSDARLPVPPIIIDEGAARLFWPNRSAVGMDLMMPAKAGLRPSRIVGVVRTAPIYGVHYGRMRPQIYTTLDPEPGLMQFLVRTVGEHAPAASKLRQVVRDVEPRQPVESVATLQQLISDQVVPDRFYVYLSLAFSIVAVIIACAGLHGLLHYVVASRKHEIGIRIAVGATAGNLVALLSGFGLRAALAGMAMGLAGSYAATRLLGSLLYAIKPDDAPTFAAAALIFTAVALLTCIAPLRAMLRVDPAECLRCD
jgi:predicted permease